jgi:arabinofuranosyltransferase
VTSVAGAVGVHGFICGEQVHIVDSWLCAPVLMRLPIGDPDLWRIGHYYRHIPSGYIETIATGEERIVDPRFRRFAKCIRSVVRDPLWSGDRWRAMFDLWTGAVGGDLNAFVASAYRQPPRVHVPASRLTVPPIRVSAAVEPCWWDAPWPVCVRHGGVSIDLPAPTTCRAVILHASRSIRYRVGFRLEDREVGTVEFAPWDVLPDKLIAHEIVVPPGAAPFDALWFDVEVNPSTDACAIGRIEFVQ